MKDETHVLGSRILSWGAYMAAAFAVCSFGQKAQAADSSLLWDGLHPTEWGSQIIAMAFNDEIGGSSNSSSNNQNMVVCLGDSITAGYGSTGYPAYLESMSGKSCVNAGIGGSATRSGYSRVRSLLFAYRPAYLCVLYGANDINQGKSASYTIENLRAICNYAADMQTCPILATLTPMTGKYQKNNAAVSSLNAKIRDLANACSYRLVDLEKEFE